MVNRIRKALAQRDQGFTLIELLVVIIIIGILAAIAIPVFLNQRKKGIDAGIKSDLKNAASALEARTTDGTWTAAAGATVVSVATDFKASTNNTVVFGPSGGTHLAGYCIVGSNAGASRTFYYNSQTGGLTLTACT